MMPLFFFFFFLAPPGASGSAALFDSLLRFGETRYPSRRQHALAMDKHGRCAEEA